jgi:hypothetical protein
MASTPSDTKTAIKPAPAKKAAVKKVAAKKVAATKVIAQKPAEAPSPVKASPALKKPAVDKKPAKPAKAEKSKLKLVRDSFTMPSTDWALIQQLKERALGFKRTTKKSELLRAGLHVLAALTDAKLQAALNTLEPLKVGRPRSETPKNTIQKGAASKSDAPKAKG